MLVIAPWTQFWDRNYFAGVWPWLGEVMSSAHARGAVTGIGILTVAAGLVELGRGILARSARSSHPPGGPGMP